LVRYRPPDLSWPKAGKKARFNLLQCQSFAVNGTVRGDSLSQGPHLQREKRSLCGLKSTPLEA
jgi:hypothetical protein